jgi:hypothetical protein
MRTTVDIDEDVLQAAKEIAERDKTTAGKVLSDLARRGLTTPAKLRRVKYRNGIPILRSRGEIVTLEKIQKIMDAEGI